MVCHILIITHYGHAMIPYSFSIVSRVDGAYGFRYMERDPVRGKDSFAAFEEVLLLAKQKKARVTLCNFSFRDSFFFFLLFVTAKRSRCFFLSRSTNGSLPYFQRNSRRGLVEHLYLFGVKTGGGRRVGYVDRI